jgi:hypothetical protein
VTTVASSEDFISILISRGWCSTGGYGISIDSVEKNGYAFMLNATFTDPDPGDFVVQVITNPTALILIGKLPAGGYSITLDTSNYFEELLDIIWGYQEWTSTFRIFDLLICDLNADGTVDIVDIGMVAVAFGSNLGDSRYNSNADLNNDSTIDIVDVGIVAIHFGKTLS